MAGEPANMIARRVSDDLISFSGENAPPRDCVAQLIALIAELHAMEDQEEVYDSLLAAKDAKRGEEAKLVALNDGALDEI
ncbi:hypothetical protein Tco_0152019 [Tanacetum coccineum]